MVAEVVVLISVWSAIWLPNFAQDVFRFFASLWDFPATCGNVYKIKLNEIE